MLGVLGGLGPASSVYFYDLLTSHTKASCDADHIDLILSSGASTPDRTRYILGQSTENPLTHMLRDAQGLIDFGADMIAIPCNTAHYFYDELAGRLDRPVINIIRETVAFIRSLQIRRVGILATDGTIFSGAYQHVCGEYGISCVVPEQEEQQQIMRLIYDDIKGGREP